MSKKATITTVTTGYSSQSTLNDNFEAINDKLDNTLSLDGSTPNAMEADLDLDGNDLLNVGTMEVDNLTVDGTRIVDATAVPEWQGAWVTAASYNKDDLVSNSGSSYICLVDHTSGTFSTDLAASKWELFAAQGTAGAGTGDLLAANNLSDVADADTALANLGGGTKGIEIFKDTSTAAVQAALDLEVGTDVQAYDATLGDLASLSLVQGDVLYHDGSNLVRLAKGTNGQVLTMNSGATAPEWSTPSTGLILETEQATTSGTNFNFTSIPSGVNKIFVNLDQVSLDGTDDLLIRIGDSGGFANTGYLSYASYNNLAGSATNTSGFIIEVTSATIKITGTITLIRMAGNKWIANGNTVREGATQVGFMSGIKELSSTLDRVQLQRTGTNNFDNGSVNIAYE